ncbi:fumarylacetoacetate hydrolase family protein [Streptomyces sp. NPDC056690]|uniref:fumarylacetoacetate hydrolase family protein n=1 Tax=unclassified Streptomyces TaxID=2593676 RepID=UPI003630C3BF
MKLARVGAPGSERPVAIVGEKAYALDGIIGDVDAAFWESGALDRVTSAVENGALPEVLLESVRFGAPIARPSSVLCIGMNYAAHTAESGAEPPAVPILFHKAPNTVVGPYDEVAIPPGSQKTDWEVELGVVIGRRASYLDSPEDSRDHIAGYVLVNDLSERSYQLDVSGGQWSKGKSCEGFCPTGPWLVTPDEFDPADAAISSWVNGQPRQASRTADMIFDVPTVVHHLSQYLVLEPGDLICTGTPEGVALSGRFPYLSAGDVVELSIDGLGKQHQTFKKA